MNREEEVARVKGILSRGIGTVVEQNPQGYAAARLNEFIRNEYLKEAVEREAAFLNELGLAKVTLVPVEVFGTESYGLCDAVSAYSDCNRAVGKIYRRDDESSVPYRDPDDVITVYVPKSELHKFDKKFGDDYERTT